MCGGMPGMRRGGSAGASSSDDQGEMLHKAGLVVKNTFIDEMPSSDPACGGSRRRSCSFPSCGRSQIEATALPGESFSEPASPSAGSRGRLSSDEGVEGAIPCRVEADHPAVVSLRTMILERCSFLRVENYSYSRRRKAKRAIYMFAGALTLFVPTLGNVPAEPLMSSVASALSEAGCSVQWRKGQLYVSDATKLCVIGVKISSCPA